MPPQDRLDDLTAREREVLDLVRLGLTNEEIAGRLGITEAGAKYHVSQILSKLGVTTREEAAAVTPSPHQRWWAALPLVAKAAAVAVVLAAVAGLGLLAWGVLRTSDDAETSQAGLPASASPRSTVSILGTVVQVDYTAGTMTIRASDTGLGEFDARLTRDSLIQEAAGGKPSPDGPRPKDGETVIATLRSPGPPYDVKDLFLDPEVFKVEGASMSPTLDNGTDVGVVPYGQASPARGDIVVFASPTAVNRSFVKRVIGLPGDRIDITADGEVILNGEILDEAYVRGVTNCNSSCDGPVSIPAQGSPEARTECGSEACYFVMGDNRQNSSDSRQGWLVPLENIRGRVEPPSPTP